MLSRNEKVRAYLHVSIDKILDELLAKNIPLETANIVFDMRRAFHDVDEGNLPGPVEYRHIKEEKPSNPWSTWPKTD